ncbi:MAG TPA: pseudouridine synthase [Opitutaceae bacterium]
MAPPAVKDGGRVVLWLLASRPKQAMSSEGQLAFPPGVLSEGPARLPVLYRANGWFAVGKPPGVAVEARPSSAYLGVVCAIRRGIEAGRGQFQRLGYSTAEPVTDLDVDVSGVLLIAGERDSGARLRNALGSNQIEFHFAIVGEGVIDQQQGFTCECDLPLTIRIGDGRAEVSHRSGRKCSTIFELVAQKSGYSLWNARSSFCRHHQIRLHSHEIGLRIAGESIYATVNPVRLLDLRGRASGRERMKEEVSPRLFLHLGRLVVSEPEANAAPVTIVAAPPKWFAAAVRDLTGEWRA